MKNAFCAILLMTSSFVHAGESPTPLAPLEGDWRLAFADEFDGTNADLDRTWNFQNGPSGHILCSRWRENAVIGNGTLKLVNRKESRGGQDWTSASLWTKREFQYGYFECRYRYAASNGTNNSFWLMPRSNKTPERGSLFEVDINEGHFPSEVNTNIHDWTNLVEVNGKLTSKRSPKSFPFGVEPGRTIQLESPVTTSKLRLTSDYRTQFHLREFRAYGFSPSAFPDIMKAPPGSAPQDYIRDPSTKITGSGFYADRPATTLRNVADADPTTSWVSQTEGPKWIEFEFAQPRTIGCVQFLSGWKESGNWNAVLDNYHVQYFNGTTWVDLSTFDASKAAVNFARDFNTFSLKWDEKELVFYLNGKELRREKNAFCFGPTPVLLSLAIIPWDGPVTDAVDGTFMEVDYVRIFESTGNAK